jgi:hypothetical protein
MTIDTWRKFVLGAALTVLCLSATMVRRRRQRGIVGGVQQGGRRSRLNQFAAWVWQGHLNDLLGRREGALAA